MEIGKTNTLRASRTTDNGCYLIDNHGNEVLLPNAYVADTLNLGDDIDVYVYKDNEERPVATTLIPKVELDKFAFLKVMDVNNAGAFMDMGLVKQLLVPYSEQPVKMEADEWYVVFCLLDDKTDRLIGSGQIEDFLFTEDLELEEGQEVNILMYKRSELGMNVIINGMYQGLIFKNDIHKPVQVGDERKAFVKTIRPDGKVDLTLEPQGYRNVIDKATQGVLDILEKEGGHFKFHDKSDPDDIRKVFQMSKKAFKKALGNLYKSKIVILEKDGTKLIGNRSQVKSKQVPSD
ncbi:S1-like domain-containing RNA-binding protein [Bacteroidia bacterium]|jgi:predicted RNA-binding protein (virulence factor B family)|nr:S1-like domain-containing RNA-binding protein [Bacteroidia bacterium]